MSLLSQSVTLAKIYCFITVGTLFTRWSLTVLTSSGLESIGLRAWVVCQMYS